MISQRLTHLHRLLFTVLVFLSPSQLGKHFWPSWSMVFGIRVDYLSPTIYLTDVIALLMLVVWSVDRLVLGKKKLPINRTSWYLVVLFLVYLFVTSLFIAHNPAAALYKLARVVEFFLVAWYVYSARPPLRLPLLGALLYISLIGWGQFIVQRTLGGPLWLLGERSFTAATPGIALFSWGGQDYLRPYSVFPHPNALAGFLLAGLILIWPRQYHRWFIPLAALVVGTIVITVSRGGWLAAVVVVVVAALPPLRRRLPKLAVLTLAATFIGSLLLPFLSVLTPGSQTIATRLGLAQAAGAMIGAFPITGVGLNNFIVNLPGYTPLPAIGWWLQPVHNMVLLIASETGVVGLAISMWLWYMMLVKLPVGQTRLGLVGLVIVITGFFDHYWLTLQQTQLLLAFVIGLAARGKVQ